MKKTTFEWFYIIMITLLLSGAWYITDDAEQKNQILTALISMLSMVGGFLFGRSLPESDKV